MASGSDRPMPNPADLQRRPLVAADADEVLALVTAYDREFFGEPMTDLEDILSEWQVPDFDLGRDTIALWDGDQLVATAELQPRGRMEVQVAAGWRDLGLEDELFQGLEQRAVDRGIAEVNQFVAEQNEGAAARAQQRGYRLHHTSWILQLEPDARIATRELPPGYAVRPFKPADAQAAFAVIADSFGEWATGPPRTFPEWEAQTLRRPGVDTSNFRVATFQGEVVGTCVVFDSEDEAWVSELATSREHRRRGVAQQLLAEVYAAARERGLAKGGLSTDTRTGALDLYLRLGMSVRQTIHNWSLDLRDRR